jgi:hypothetical protein
VLCLRHVAALTDTARRPERRRPRQRARIAAIVLGAVAVLALPAGLAAADPSAPPEPRRPTCAERFPEEGPAGVDLRLGCIVSELVGLYTPGQASAPPAVSTYAIGAAAAIAALVLAVAVATRLLARRAGQALAPVTPDAWWQCPTCRSVNGVGATRCYSCGSQRPADVTLMLATEESPGTPQSFGRGKRG